MALIIDNVDDVELDDDERRRLEEFLRASLGEDAQDEELKAYLLNFVSEDGDNIHLDAAEIYSSTMVQERFEAATTAQQADLLDDFGNFDAFEDMGVDAVPGPDDEIGTGQAQGENPFDVELDMPTPATEPEIVLPDSQIEVPEAFSSPEPAPEAVSQTIFEPEPQPGVEEGDQAPQAERGHGATDADQTYDGDMKRLQELAAVAGQMQGGGGAGGSPSPSGQEGDAISAAVNGIARGLGSIPGALSKGAVESFNWAKSARSNSSELDQHQALVEKSRAMLSGERPDLGSSDMAMLRGDQESSNVIDIRNRLREAVSQFTPESVGRNLSMIRQAGLEDKRNALVSTMQGIEEGFPDGRYSAMSVMPGVTLGNALKAAQNPDPTVATMARSSLAGMTELNAVNEMEFKACEYQEIHDALEALSEEATEHGMTQEEINDQFASPVQTWLERQQEEDLALAQLADAQNTGGGELSEEELAERKEAIERMAEKIQELIDKIMGRGQEKEQTITASR